MKSLWATALLVSLSLVSKADDLDTYYAGDLVSSSKEISVKYKDGQVRTFDVQHVGSGTLTNESFMKVATLKSRSRSSGCSKQIGELASDYSFVLKTDENELVTLNFKASTPEEPVRIAGDCDGGIFGDFSIYNADKQALPLQVSMSQEPVGAPRAGARYEGSVLKITPKLTVRSADGTLRELDSSSLAFGGIYNDIKSVILSSDGTSTRCGDSLGELAADFEVTIKTRKGMVRTATVHAATAGAPQDRIVRVFGACNGNSVTELQLAVGNKSSFEIR